MQIRVIPIAAFEDNYFWLLVRDGHAAVVDPGLAEPVADTLADLRLQLDAILVTHHHADHIGGVRSLKTSTGARVFAPQDYRIGGVDVRVGDGDSVSLPSLDLRFQVLATPGHTLTHIAYSGHGMLFCGDTLFSLGCGRLFEGSPRQMLASLDRIAALPAQTQIYCAHEYTLANARFARTVDPENAALAERTREAENARRRGQPTLPVDLGIELTANPFLRCDSEGVRAGLADRVEKHADRLECFTALRRWKDTFR